MERQVVILMTHQAKSSGIGILGRRIASVIPALPLALVPALLLTPTWGTQVRAQSEAPPQAEASASDEPEIPWELGPKKVDLGALGQMDIPAGFRFTGKEGTRIFYELTHNPISGNELGVLIPPITANDNTDDLWFIIFTFDDIGYVKDDDKNSLDSKTKATIFNSLKEGTEEGNKIRLQRGWSPVTVDRWEQEPFYDAQSNNLKWALICGGQEGQSVNYNTRMLCREGVLSANMVVDPKLLAAAAPTYEKLIGAITINPGKRYSEFRAGDKVAQYGLIALMTGAGGAALVKTGIFAKFLKPIIIGVIVFFAAIYNGLKTVMRKLFGGSNSEPETFTASASGSDPHATE